MYNSSGYSGESIQKTFADQFESKGAYLIYRCSQKGEAIRVSEDERNRFIEEFDRSMRRSKWIAYIGIAFVIGGIAGSSLIIEVDLDQGALYAGIAAVMFLYLGYMYWAWGAPARELAGRTPIAGKRPRDEVRRLQFQRMTYGQLAVAAFGGLAIPFGVGSSDDIFSGWSRLWLVFGGALILIATIQAFRKWSFEREDSYRNIISRLPEPKIIGPSEQSEPAGKSKLWRYIPFALILLGLGFVGFTSAGEQLAKQPSFWPIVMVAGGAWCLSMVAEGFAKGRVQPLARGFQDIYERQAQPKMFWASMLWNGFCAGFFFLIAFAVWQDASPQAVQDHCYNQHGDFGARDANQSCTKLIEGREKRTYLTKGDAYVYRAIAAERMGDRSRALADYSEGIRLEPTNEYAYLQRGLLHLEAMRLDQSIADFSRAHELRPKSIWPLADRGLAYAWKNDRPRAEADFAAVRGIDPTNIVVLHGQGVLEMTSGNLEAAVDRFTAAVRQDPSDAWAIQMRADCYQQMGQFEKAREDRRRLVRLRGDGSD